MRFFEWMLPRRMQANPQHEQHVGEMLERVLAMVPRLRVAERYQIRLASAIAAGLKYLEQLVADLPEPIKVGPLEWGLDPRVRAFFSSPAELSLTLGRSSALREFFTDAFGAAEAYAVLGMNLDERRRFGTVQEGDTTRADVASTTVVFWDHQIPICARSVVELRREIVTRLVDQLALQGLSQMAHEEVRREALMRDRALLAARVRLMQRRGIGLMSLVGSAPELDNSALARLREEIQANERDLDRLGPLTETLDRHAETMCDVFRNPGPLVHVHARSLRLSRMNVVLSHGSREVGDIVEFQIALVPGDPPRDRAFSLVRCTRSDVPAPVNLLQEAERWLG
ncbi:hypothetical protein [Caldimonas brevitalea]|uniref:Uncharacterized protein n=1 Tax=Caldimonas brevitalea TaxID=413882 RepID=A0A0G3BS36_9BURK|nr:hypothetical protein [Caldimonas brevitalea]AKJ29320.1 hypothetical protein AAW51_2629 [Caldimonas brevitalea]